MEKFMNSFINEYSNDFLEFFDNHRAKKLINREDYKNLRDKKRKIMEEYPKARTFLEDEKIIDMTNEEKKAVLRIIDIQEKIKIIELKEAFKLGGKEAYILAEEMDMLNI